MSHLSLTIDPDKPAFEMVNQIVGHHLRQAHSLEAGVLKDDDIEHLHQYRVNLRKVRSAISLFATVYSGGQAQRLKQASSKLMSPTGALRDLDVYLADKTNYYRLLSEVFHPGLDLLFAKFAEQRTAEYKKLKSYLTSKRYRRSFDELVSLVEKGKATKAKRATRDFLSLSNQLAHKRYSKICRTASQISSATPDAELHKIRIQCKKFRYLLEFTGSLIEPTQASDWLKSSKQLQKQLGQFNDYCVQQQYLQKFLEEHIHAHQSNIGSFGNKEQIMLVSESVGALLSLLQQKQSEQREAVIDQIKHLTKSVVVEK